MEEIQTSKTRFFRKLNITLLAITGALAALLLIGTIAGIVGKGDAPLISFSNSKTNQNTDAAWGSSLDSDIRVFSGIGRLRIPLVNSSVMILSIAFPYPDSDTAFKEELAGKINEFKNIAINYFSSLPESEIVIINEEAAKTEILRQFNASLRLGRISALYFNDLMVIDAY